MRYIITLSLVFVVYSTKVCAQAGKLDRSFGDTGIVMGTAYTGKCHNLLIQTDGKIVATGTGGYNNVGGFLVVRYNNDGSTDLSFGDSGRVATNLSHIGSNGGYSALQPDGKIVMTGIVVLSGVSGQSVVLIRYNTDGSLDNSFGDSGTIINDLGSETEDPSGILIQPDGKIVITGSLQNHDKGDGPDTIYILRYNTDGTLDASFAKSGIYKEAALDLDPIETAGAALQQDGKILLGGNYEFSRSHAFFVKRYTQNGKLDSAFGVDGEARYEFSHVIGSYISSIYLQADGKIVAGGASYFIGERSNATLVRFNADGTVDNGFGKMGSETTEIGNYGSEIKEITEQTDKKILIAGNVFDSSERDSGKFTVIRYLENGTLDSSFGIDGITTTYLGFDAKASSIVLQNDNRIVLGGFLFKLTPPYYFVTLARYNGDGTIITRIKHWIRNHIIHWQDNEPGKISFYTIEKSKHANSGFVQIARVPLNSINTYSYEDNNAGSGNNYYRISSVSANGSTISSDVVSDISITSVAAITVTPNPVNNVMTIKTLSPDTKYKVRITNSSGTLVASKELRDLSFYNWNVSSLKGGIYYVSVASADNNNVLLKFVKE